MNRIELRINLNSLAVYFAVIQLQNPIHFYKE